MEDKENYMQVYLHLQDISLMGWPALQNKPCACVKQNDEARGETCSHRASRRAHRQVANESRTQIVVCQAEFMLGDIREVLSPSSLT